MRRSIALGLALLALAGSGCAAGRGDASAAPISREQFDQVFPHHAPFYTYDGFAAAAARYPAFGNTGDDTTRRREVAAFLANVDHETGGLTLTVESDRNAYGNYCDTTQPYGCPAGPRAYYGRGPVQLSWNYNYERAGDALRVDLLDDPALLERDPAVSWASALWFWDSPALDGSPSPHDVMVSGQGFGATIRAFNGALECAGQRPDQVGDRVAAYRRMTALLGVSPGDELTC